MNPRSIANVFGTLMIVTGCSMVLPLFCSLFYEGDDAAAFCIAAALIIGCGLPMKRIFRGANQLSFRDSMFIATFGWIWISALSTLPFIIHGAIPY